MPALSDREKIMRAILSEAEYLRELHEHEQTHARRHRSPELDELGELDASDSDIDMATSSSSSSSSSSDTDTDDDGGSATSDSSDDSDQEGGGSDKEEAEAEGSGEDDSDDEVQELDPKHHPLLRPGAMPKKMSKAAKEAAVKIIEQAFVGGGSDGEDEDYEDEEQEDQLDD